MSFKVGEKVVCVKPIIGFLIKNEIYTCMGYDDIYKKEIGILELGKHENGRYYCCSENRFRKLDYNFVEEVISKIKQQPVEI